MGNEMKTETKIKIALRLYKLNITESKEYFEIASSLGMNTGELNKRCWQINYDKKTHNPKGNETMRNYLQTLIKEKGIELESEITLDGHIGVTWQMLVDFIVEAKEYHGEIRNTLVTIDFKNGDIFDYLTHLARGMVASVGC